MQPPTHPHAQTHAQTLTQMSLLTAAYQAPPATSWRLFLGTTFAYLGEVKLLSTTASPPITSHSGGEKRRISERRECVCVCVCVCVCIYIHICSTLSCALLLLPYLIRVFTVSEPLLLLIIKWVFRMFQKVPLI